MSRLSTCLFRVCLLLLSFCLSPAHAIRPYQPQLRDPLQEPWRWRSFSQLEGKGLRCLIEDADGDIWFGVDRGTMRYDGLHWVEYEIRHGQEYVPANALCSTRNKVPLRSISRG